MEQIEEYIAQYRAGLITDFECYRRIAMYAARMAEASKPVGYKPLEE